MNTIANNIKQRLSLREPLCKALDVVVRLTDKLSLTKQSKDAESTEYLEQELKIVKELCPSCRDFERDFPSFAFSIATGIGKTRLMAACIAYLYLKKGIRHFFILAPNLTLYEKLMRDFGEPSYEKYVFKGITEFVHNQPVVITGDNYEQARTLFSKNEIQINIFNIAKFNSDSKESKKGTPRMKRLSEYLGQSYFDYLSNLDDLVILMDEAHRYHADASKKAINELRPVLGLEMTATPHDDKGKAFRNIVYEYNLAEALADGKYVKNPTVAKRKNFEKKDKSPEELDVMKLEDAISIHENTKFNLELYAKENNVSLVKPFILVVCKNIQHSNDTVALIENKLFDGKYKGKVLQIDSSTKKDEEIDRQFVSLESPDNQIEIVVHVNMLKEGWDVTNLYTIVPLRAADAITLVEQTIGRGLRLPYGGRRTNNKEVDKLTVIAHENFEEVLKRAQDPNSLLNKFSFVELEDDAFDPEADRIFTGTTSIDEKFKAEKEKAEQLYEKELAKTIFDAKRAVWQAIPKLNTEVKSKEELIKPENIAKLKKITEGLINRNAVTANPLFAEEEAEKQIKEIDRVIQAVTVDFIQNVIEIPRVVIEQPEAKAIFTSFDLDTTQGFSFPELSEEILRMGMVDKEVEILQAKSSGFYGNPVQQIVVQLMNFEDIDYDQNAELLYHLAEQAVQAITQCSSNDEDISKKVSQFKTAIANQIYKQMKQHFTLEIGEFRRSKTLPFTELLPQHLKESTSYGQRDYRDIITPLSWVKKFIFVGFEKSFYREYKFDSSTEQYFAFILETDSKVIKWLRPVPLQFNIYWANGARRYEPDFIVETADKIFMIETKASKDMEADEVQAKRVAAEEYCKQASAYTSLHGGKSWQYVMIAHDCVDRAHSFEYVIAKSI